MFARGAEAGKSGTGIDGAGDFAPDGSFKAHGTLTAGGSHDELEDIYAARVASSVERSRRTEAFEERSEEGGGGL